MPALNSFPLVSIVASSYNHARYVQDMIRSCLAQTYAHVELLMIDDGSPDQTAALTQEMYNTCKERFVRVEFLSQDNQGIGATLNTLIAMAEGKYILLMASDDLLSETAVADMVDYMERHADCGMVVGENLLIDNDGRRCYWARKKKVVYTPQEALYLSFSDYLQKRTGVDFASDDFGSYESLLKGNHIPNGYLLRKEVLEKTGPYRAEAPQEDYWLMLQVAKYMRIASIDRHTYYYRWHGDNTVSKRRHMRKKGALTMAYEEGLLRSQWNGSSYLEAFLRLTCKEKTFFSIPGVCRLFMRDNRYSKTWRLGLSSGRECVLLKKDYRAG